MASITTGEKARQTARAGTGRAGNIRSGIVFVEPLADGSDRYTKVTLPSTTYTFVRGQSS